MNVQNSNSEWRNVREITEGAAYDIARSAQEEISDLGYETVMVHPPSRQNWIKNTQYSTTESHTIQIFDEDLDFDIREIVIKVEIDPSQQYSITIKMYDDQILLYDNEVVYRALCDRLKARAFVNFNQVFWDKQAAVEEITNLL